MKPKRQTGGFVYLAECGGFYKIGMTTGSVGARISALGNGNPFPVRLAHSIACRNPIEVEARLHKQYEALRGKGEWFNLAPEHVEQIRAMRLVETDDFFIPRVSVTIQGINLGEEIARIELSCVFQALKLANGNKSHAAQLLQIDRKTLYRYLEAGKYFTDEERDEILALRA
jgi:hypothetical protein